VSYVEFQKNYRSLLEYHKAALEATRDFWRLIMRDAVPVGANQGNMDIYAIAAGVNEAG
jgi:hypothetical protein